MFIWCLGGVVFDCEVLVRLIVGRLVNSVVYSFLFCIHVMVFVLVCGSLLICV